MALQALTDPDIEDTCHLQSPPEVLVPYKKATQQVWHKKRSHALGLVRQQPPLLVDSRGPHNKYVFLSYNPMLITHVYVMLYVKNIML
jgi:hypothetical protein